MAEGNFPMMTHKKTIKHLKVGKSNLNNMAGDGKIPAVKIELGRNNKIIIRVPYHQDLINKVKSIPKRKWNPKEKYWEIPDSEDLITKLQALFGENLVIDPYFYLLPLQKELSIRKYSKRTIKSYWALL